jgi:hypothetical protein
MVRQGQFEMKVVSLTGTTYIERKINNRTYLQAGNGEEFAVIVNVFRDRLGNYPVEDLTFDLYIDTKNVGYRKSAAFTKFEPNLPPQCFANHFQAVAFNGFRHGSKELHSFSFHMDGSSENMIQFATSKSTAVKKGIRLGNIKLVVRKLGYLLDKSTTVEVQAPLMPFKAESLTATTVKGRRLSDLNISATYAMPQQGEPLATVVLPYHTASTLNVLSRMAKSDKTSSRGQDAVRMVTPAFNSGGSVHSTMEVKPAVPKRSIMRLSKKSSSKVHCA